MLAALRSIARRLRSVPEAFRHAPRYVQVGLFALLGVGYGLYVLFGRAEAETVAWWDGNFSNRQIIHIRNDSNLDMPQGYTLLFNLDHASLVSAGQSLSNGNDIRIVYYSRTRKVNVELDRLAATSWNTSATEIRFRAQNRLKSGRESRDYYLYYNNPAAGGPPADQNNVYLIYDDFSGTLSKWGTPGTGSWSISSGVLDSADSSNTHYFLQQSYLPTPSAFEMEWKGYSPFDGSIWNFFMTLRENPADTQQRIVVGAREGADEWRVEQWTSSTAETTYTSYSQTIDRGIWYSCKVRLNGNVITFWVDGAQKFTYTMTGAETTWNTVMGLGNEDSHAQFDDVKFRYYISPEPVVQLEEAWKSGAYGYRQRITITNNVGSQALPAGYSVRADLTHATWVTGGKAQADGDDVRIVYWNGSTYVEVPRTNSTAWNSGNTRVYFPTQASIAASGSDNNYYVYYGNTAALAPSSNPSDVYLWYDDFSSNTAVSQGDDWANSVVSSTAVTEDYKAVGTETANQSASISAGGQLILDMGEGEEITNGSSNDLRVRTSSGGGNNFDVYGSAWELGPWTLIGSSTGSSVNLDLASSGLSVARYIRIVRTAGTPQIRSVEAYNRNATVATSGYENGKHVDIDGTNSAQARYDSTRQAASFDTGDNFNGGLRISTINEQNLLVQADWNTFRAYPTNGTATLITRWSATATNYYTHFSNGSFTSPGITRGSGSSRSTLVAAPGSNSYFPCCTVGTGNGGSGDGINVQSSTATSSGGQTGNDTIRYGIYQNGANSVHRFWVNNDTDAAATLQNLAYADGGYASTGQPAFQANQQWGWFDNIVVRRYFYPEPSFALSGESASGDFKVTGIHTSTNPVSAGSSDVEILRLDIEGGTSQTLTQIVVSSLNTSDSDVSGVSAYYTGTSTTFSTSNPFGTTGQAFTAGSVTFTGSRSLPNNQLVHVFIVYNVAGGATPGNTLDAQITAGNVTISAVNYPSTVAISPSGARTISAPQSLSTITVTNIDTSTVKPSASNAQILRLDFAVTGTGAPLTIQQIKVTSTNIADTDVSGVSAYYTGTSSTFSTTTPFGATNQPFAAGKVTFNGGQDMGNGSAPGTFYAFIVYTLSSTAVIGNTVDAKIVTNDITVEGSTYPASDQNPAGNRTIAVPTGSVTSLPPITSLVNSDPSLQPWQNFNNTDGGDPDLWVDNLEADDGLYAGGQMASVGILFDPQMTSVEFTFDLDDQVSGIAGNDINTLTFRAEMYLTGANNGSAPQTDTADWTKISDSAVDLYNYTTATWEEIGDPFLTNTPSGWQNTAEAGVWDESGDTNPERPLRRFKGSGFTNDYLDSNGRLKMRVRVEGQINATGDEINMIFDYAQIDVSYGANVEQVAFRWADDAEASTQDENKSYSTVIGTQLHLRGSVRSRYKPFGSHRLGLQYDTDSAFTSGDGFNPVIMTAATAEIRYWDDADHLEGDPVSGTKLLTGSNADGIYHEDDIPPSQSKNQDLIYEEDVAVVGQAAGTYYARLVKVDGFGALLGALDYYANAITITVSSTSVQQEGYAWAVNVASPSFGSPNTPLEFTPGTNYILATRPANVGTSAASYRWQIEFQRINGVPGPWVAVNTSSPEWIAVDGVYAANDTSIATGSFVTGPGTGTSAAGRYSEVGIVRSPTLSFNLAAGNYTELWYSIQPQSDAAGNNYRFRLTNNQSTGGFAYTQLGEAQQTTREEVSYRLADESDAGLSNENTAATVAKNQLFHLRVGVRSNNGTWSGQRLGVQYDTVSTFASAVVATPSSSTVYMWDDGDHADESTVTGSLLSGTPTMGRFHETNVLVSTEPAMSADVLYEADFALTVDTVGTYYLRVVRLDAAGALVGTLDTYSQLITVLVVNPTLRQNYYAWAPDAASPVFQTTDTQLEMTPGNIYLLAVQAENRSGLGNAPWWNSGWDYREQIQVVNTAASTLPADYSVKITINHQDIVGQGRSTPGGNDVRIVYYNGATNTELDRVTETSWNSTSTEIWFKTKVAIAAGLDDKEYYLYYDNDQGSTTPPANRSAVYAFYDDFSGTLSQWDTGGAAGTWTINGTDDARVDDSGNQHFYLRQTAVSVPADRYVEMLTRPLSSACGNWENTFLLNFRDGATGDLSVDGARVGADYWRLEEWDISAWTSTTISQNPQVINPDTWYKMGLIIQGTNHKLYIDNNLRLDTTYSTAWSPIIGIGADNACAEFDYIKARRYISPEPSTTVGGTSASVTWQLQYQKINGTPGSWTNVTTSSADWKAVDATYSVDGQAITATSGFKTNSGSPPGPGVTAVDGTYSETGSFLQVLAAMRYTEHWYALQPTVSATNNKYQFRLTNSGNAGSFTFTVYPIGRQTATEQVSFRWLDPGEAALGAENASVDATVNDALHLRAGLRPNNGPWTTHYLALQYDTDINFTAPTLVTTSSSNIRMWDDGDHTEGAGVTPLMLGGSPTAGVYHEDSVPPSQNKTADTLYEEDFTVTVLTTGTYYLRVVEVDAFGSFLKVLKIYTQAIAITGNNPMATQNSFNWGAGELTGSSGFGTADASLEYAPSSTYTLAVRMSNGSAVPAGFDWRLQYQKTNGTPGSWTDVTTTSADWKAVAGGTGQDGNAIATANFVTNAGSGSLINGRYSETGAHGGYSLSATSQTEFRYELQPQSAAAGKAYRFRLTNSGSTSAFTYSVYAIAQDTTHEQVSWRWADESEIALEAQNTSYNSAVGQLLHLRAGIRSNNGAWNNHKLSLQYDTNSAFPSPVNVTTATANVQMWDDSDRVEGTNVAATILTGSPTAGLYHEVENQSVTQSKTLDTLYEEDFTVTITATGTYYLRAVDYNGGSPAVLDTYSSPVIAVTATVPSVGQNGYNWSPNQASPAWQTANTMLSFATSTTYILAVRAKNTGGSPATLNWRLQYQKDPTGSPGAWTNITTSSNDWRAVDGVYGLDNTNVATGSFSTGSETGTGVSGMYSEDGIVSSFTLNSNEYSELWFSIQPLSSAALNRYKFRLTDNGATGPFAYNQSPEAAQLVTQQVSFRWADAAEAALATENSSFNANVNDTVHLRTGLKGKHLTWSTHYLSLQYDTDINFAAPTLVTTSSSNIQYWNDTDHLKGDAVTGSILSSSPTAGKYHEDGVPPGQTANADTLYEEDFTVKVTSTGTYYLRVVETDSSGVFLKVLNNYLQTISLTGNNPATSQDSFNWGAGELTAGTGFGTADSVIEITPGTTYTLAVRVSNTGAVPNNYDWRLQYQRTTGTPGPWTDLTTGSVDWKAVVNTVQDGTAITTGNFVTNAGAGTAANGRYSETGAQGTYSLGAGNQTELRYEIQPQSAASGKAYSFRITNSGSTAGISYTILAQAKDTTHEQVSFRWADGAENQLALENNAYTAAVNQQLHLRTGIKSNNSPWNGHYLALQYDTVSSFANANGAPSTYLITTSSTPIKYWDDADHLNNDALSGTLLSGTPTAGRYHESNVVSSQNKSLDILYEEDFTVEIGASGTYYLRVVEVDNTGAYVGLLDTYTQAISFSATVPNVSLAAYEWAQNVASPDWSGPSNTIKEFTTSTTYIAAVRMENTGASPSTFSWRLEYQKDPTGSPGPWTAVTTTSTDWRAVDGAYGADNASVSTGSFVTGTGTGTGVNGVYCEDGIVSSFTLGAGEFTELWYSVQPQGSSALNRYRFRITDNGANGSFVYTVYPEAAQRVKEQVAYRWADKTEIALEPENTQAIVSPNDLVRVRVGIKSKHLSWTGHNLALQFDTSSLFPAPTLITGASATIRGWNDTDYNDGHLDGDSPVTALALSGSPTGGVYHEDNDQPAAQNKSADTLYEEDFTIKPTAIGNYYLRAVEVDASGANPQVLNTYTVTIELAVQSAGNAQGAFDVADDAASLTWKGDNGEFYFTPGNKYVVAVRIDHSDPNSNYTWVLQYQKDPNGSPGPWTSITNTSTDWKMAPTGTYAKANGASVTSGERGTSGGNPWVNGEYWNSDTDTAYTAAGNPTTTELWFRVQADATATDGQEYRFRITNNGSTSGLTYTVYPSATNFKKISSGAWNTGGNWTPSGVPTGSENVVVQGAAITMDAAAGACKKLIIDGGFALDILASNTLTVNDTLTVRSGGTLRVNNTSAVLVALQNATVESGGTLELASTGAFQLAGGKSLTINGTFNSSGSGSGPTLTRNGGSGTIDVTLTGTVNITKLQFSYGDLQGLDVSSTATITDLAGIRFTNIDSGVGARFLSIARASGTVSVRGGYFDTVGGSQYNIRLQDTNGGSDLVGCAENRGVGTSGPGAGAAYESEVNTAILNWMWSCSSDTSGTIAGFPTLAFDWTTYAQYAVYVAFTDTGGAGTVDRIYVRDTAGNPLYTYDIAEANGNILGTPIWDTKSETVFGPCDMNNDGDSTDSLHVLYVPTGKADPGSVAKIFLLVDTGTALQLPKAGCPWQAAYSHANVDEITSPLIYDLNNLYFGGENAADGARIFGVQIADTDTTPDAPAKDVGAASRVQTAPSWRNISGTVYLYAGSKAAGACGGGAHLYRVDTTGSGSVDSDNTTPVQHVNSTLTLMSNKVYGGDDGGRMHGVDNGTVGLPNLSGYPYRDTTNHTVGDLDNCLYKITAAPYVTYSTWKVEYGDSDGHFYVLSSSGTPQSGYPFRPGGSTAAFTNGGLMLSGVMVVGNANGKLYYIDESAANLFLTYDFGSGVAIGQVGYNSNQQKFMIGTSNGGLYFLNKETDPTP
ncbi:MAG: hypothetical protein HYY13_05385 [Nitrospirae bacterium]|nr:hypothetical protein [Nitrospirota bacterium]